MPLNERRPAVFARIVVAARSIAGCSQVEHQKQAAVPAEGQHGLGLHTGHTVQHAHPS